MKSNNCEISKKQAEQITKDEIKKIGFNLKTLRLKNKYTQSDVAFYTFSDKSMISALERGVCKNITLLSLTRIALLFNIEVEDLLK